MDGTELLPVEMLGRLYSDGLAMEFPLNIHMSVPGGESVQHGVTVLVGKVHLDENARTSGVSDSTQQTQKFAAVMVCVPP